MSGPEFALCRMGPLAIKEMRASFRMQKSRSWLFGEIERWTRDGLITAEQATRLRSRYPGPVVGRSWGMVVFTGIGAVVVGLGIILLLAYNWSEIPRAAKLVLIFGCVGASHGLGLFWRGAGGGRSQVAEALSLLGTMAFGAGIWLVAQLYHINEHFPTGFLLWGGGALAMAWALLSPAQGLVATVTLTIWGSCEVLGFASPPHAALGALLLGVGPLAWRLRSPLLLAGLLAGVFFLLPVGSSFWGRAAGGYLATLSLSLLLLGLRALSATEASGRFDRVIGFYGLAGFLGCAFVASFPDVAEGLLRRPVLTNPSRYGALVVAGGMAVAAFGVWGAVWRRRTIRGVRLEEWVFPATGLFAHVVVLTGVADDGWLVAGLFNLVVLAVATLWMVRGCREGRLAPTVLGSLVLGAVVFARYFDLFESLAARGLAFLILGGVLFAEGFYYRRTITETTEVEAES